MSTKEKHFKEKVKGFYEKHKGAIIGGAIGGALAVLKFYNVMTYGKGFRDGGAVSFHVTMDYFDENRGTNLNQIFEKIAKEHPEQIVTRRIK